METVNEEPLQYMVFHQLMTLTSEAFPGVCENIGYPDQSFWDNSHLDNHTRK